MKHFYIVFLCLFFVNAVDVHARSIPIDIGGTEILIPAPQGFVEVGERNRSKIIPTGATMNRRLAVFLSEFDFARFLRTGETDHFSRHMIVEVYKQIEPFYISQKDFHKIVKDTKKATENLKKIEDGIVSMMNDQLNDQSQMTGVEMHILGNFSEADNFLSYTTLIKYLSGSGNPPQLMVIEHSVVYIGNKAFFVFVYNHYNNQKDINWVRQTARKWVQNILSSSKIVKIPEKQPSLQGRGLWDGAAEKGLMGGLVGGLFGMLFFFLFRRKKS